VTITVTCYSWAPSSGDHFFTCGAIYRPPHYIMPMAIAGRDEHGSGLKSFFRISVGSRLPDGRYFTGLVGVLLLI